MAKRRTKTATPRLRFPEFRGASAWKLGSLASVGSFVNDKIAVANLSLSNYVSTENLGPDYGGITASAKLPDVGSVTRFKRNDVLISNIRPYLKKVWLADRDGGASNDVIVVRNKSVISDAFLSLVLRNDAFIAYVMNGAKGVKMPRGDIDAMRQYPVAFPEAVEQQKIADCLTSLDEVIAAQGRKVEALKAHKRGLMQQLFPREGETRPRLRFPEFRNAPEWKVKVLRDIASISSGTTPLRANSEFYDGGTIPWVKTADLNNESIFTTQECITPKAKATINPAGSVLVAMYGGFNQIGRTGLLRVPAATNQALSVLRSKPEAVLPTYLLAWLNAKVEEWKRIASSSRKDPNITSADVARFPICVPGLAEQQRIADCLASLDTRIAAETNQLAALKTHKQGLMQQLFPVLVEVSA